MSKRGRLRRVSSRTQLLEQSSLQAHRQTSQGNPPCLHGASSRSPPGLRHLLQSLDPTPHLHPLLDHPDASLRGSCCSIQGSWAGILSGDSLSSCGGLYSWNDSSSLSIV